MPDNVSKTVLQFELDRAKNKEVLNAVSALQKSLQDIGGRASDSTKTIQNLTKATEALKRQGAIDDVVKQFSSLVKSEKQAVETAIDLRKALRDVGATKDEIAGAVRSFNELTIARARATAPAGRGGLSLDRAEGLLGRAGASLSGIGLGGAGGAVSGGADALQLILSVKEGVAGLGVSAGLLGGAAIAVAPAIIAASLALDTYRKSIELSASGLARFTNNIEKFIALTSGTSAARQAGIEENQKTIGDLVRARDLLQQQIDRVIKSGSDEIYSDAFQKARDKVKALNDEITSLQELSNSAFKELESGKAAFLDLGAAASAAAQELTKATIAEAERAKQTALEQAQLKSLSLDAAKQRLDSLKDEKTATEAAIKVLKDSGNTSKEVTDRLKEYEDALKKNAEAQKYLNDVVIPAAERTRKLQEAIKGLGDVAAKAAAAAQAAAQDLIDRDKRVADVQKRYNDDVERINAQALQRRADIEKSYADKLVDIAKSAADDSRAALERLKEEQATLLRDFGREEATTQRKQQFEDMTRRVKAQNEETKAYEEHARRLLQIQRDSQLEEQDLLLNRNFLGLFQLQQRRAQETEQANTEFAQQQRDRQQALQQETQDLVAQREFERNERLIAFQQRNADALAAYQQELQQVQKQKQAALLLARQAYTNELRELSQKVSAELRLRQSAYDKELQLAALYGARRVQVEAQTQQALLAQATSRLNALGAVTNMNIGASGETGNRRPFGGAVSAGVAYAVNDAFAGQRERFGGAQFPPGLGVFIPARSGSVEGGAKGAGANITINQTIAPQSGDPVAIAKMVRAETVQVLGEVLG